ncbi:MAG: ribonuclease III [Clostridiales bacterium]|nr:ribonuclease III [Clostridiales bacterium]
MEDFLKPKLSMDAIKGFSALGLAYIGDGAFELMARTYLAANGDVTSYGMHKNAIDIVRAGAQANAARFIKAVLTDEELSVFMRGRNAKPKTLPKHADRADYAYATALEALFGWLFLNGKTERMNELFRLVIEANLKKAVIEECTD